MSEASAMAIATSSSLDSGALPSRPIVERVRPAAGSKADAWWLTAFVIWDLLAQIGMFLFGGSAVVRLPLRIGVYAASLAMLLVTLGRVSRYPPRRVLVPIIAILVLEQLHPYGDRPFAQTAQLALYVSVFAPLIWLPRLKLADPFAMFRRMALLLWLFYTTSAIFGVLQIRYPGRFDGEVSANYTAESLTPHIFQLADGTKIVRPRGLSDTPGGAAVGGVYSIIFGMGLLAADRRLWLRALAVGGMVAGLFCIYICQGRTNIIIVGLSAAVLIAVLIKRRALQRASVLIVAIAAVVVVGTGAAFAVGGASTVNRFATLIADDPGTVAYSNRGKFLDSMIRDDALTYPLGAGMGRWGMINYYFGGHTQPVWAEMMWQALLFDGGWPLVVFYGAMLTFVLRLTWRVAVRSHADALGNWAGAICGCNVAAVAASFSFPIFSLSMGLEIFLLNASLYLAFVADQRKFVPDPHRGSSTPSQPTIGASESMWLA